MMNKAKLEIKKVQVTVGIKANSTLPVTFPNAIGNITVGLKGLLDLIETQLGIPSSDVSFTTRQIQYLSCIDKTTHKAAFYHASYQEDPFSVAKTLLLWRDQWYEAGWTGVFDNDVPDRLMDMAAIEVPVAY